MANASVPFDSANTTRSEVPRRYAEDPLVFAWKAERDARIRNGRASTPRRHGPPAWIRAMLGWLALLLPLALARAHRPATAIVSLGVLLFASLISSRQWLARFGDEQSGALLVLSEADATWARGDKRRAAALTFEAAARARSAELRERLWTLLAERALVIGDPCLVHAALAELPPDRIGAAIVGAYLCVCNRRDESLDFLEDALAQAPLEADALRLLIDLHHERGDRRRVLELSELPELSDRDRTAVRVALSG